MTTIAEAFSPLTRDEFIAAYEAECALNPDGNYQLGSCRHCGNPLGDQADPETKVMSFGALGFLPNVCCPACSEAGKLRLAEEDAKARQGLLSSVIPSEFIQWDAARGNNDALAAARGKFSFATRRGLILHGASGSCKTRILWELVKTIVEQPEPQSWCWLDSYDAATKGIPEEANRANFLFLDDLGNEPAGTKFETALLRLIRRRNDWHKPIFISTQLTGLQFKSRFFQGAAAEAIMRRLTERTDKIAT